jgi:hypothetical protein
MWQATRINPCPMISTHRLTTIDASLDQWLGSLAPSILRTWEARGKRDIDYQRQRADLAYQGAVSRLGEFRDQPTLD